MRSAAVSRVATSVAPSLSSVEFRLFTTRLQAWLLIGFSLAAMAVLMLPIVLIAVDGLTNPHVINTVAEHPGSTALLAAGLFIGFGLLLFPLRSGLVRLGGQTTIRVADGMVAVERRGVLRRRSWSAPLAQFCGVTHHIRATLSGPRHEIILVHPDPAKDLLLHVASRHPQDGADHYAEFLGLAELQPRALYSRRRAGDPSVELQTQPA